MKKISSKKFQVLLFALTYFISYVSRINYGAIISEIENATEIGRSLLSMAVTGSFITYGAGQIISGIFGDKISPKKLVAFGLVLTALMNFLIPVWNNPYYMLLIWCVNGFAQAFMWPPIVKLMTSLLNEKEYGNAVVKVSWGSSFGTIAVYLISPALISLFGWQAVFIFSGIFALVMVIIWSLFCTEPKDIISKSGDFKNKKTAINKIFSLTMLGIMIAIILQGMLRDGVTTWMPTYISETYELDNLIAILTAVILPVFSVFCYQVTSILYRKRFKNPLICAGVIFSVGTVSALILCCFSGSSVAVSILCSAALTGTMHGVNVMLVCMIPHFFKKYGIVSTVSGVLNSCTYVGSAISTFGIAVISEKFGWDLTLKLWLLIAVLGSIICFISVKAWKEKYQGN